jgi:peroxiredoxin
MKNHCIPRHLPAAVLASLALLLAAARTEAAEARLELLSSGATAKQGGYVPHQIELSPAAPAGLTKTPADLAAPLYGQFKLGPAESPTTFFVVLDEPEGKPARLFVDASGAGSLGEASAIAWTARTNASASGPALVSYSGRVMVHPVYGAEQAPLQIQMYRFDKNDPRRPGMARKLFYYSDYARNGRVTLGGMSYAALLSDPAASGDFRGAGGEKPSPPVLILDLNGDGKFDLRREGFPVNKPFNIGGVTYEISGMTASGSSFQIVKSARSVEKATPLPTLTAGHPAPAFTAGTTAGTVMEFPGSYKGKVVLLDFWATWCGPCVNEMPHVTAAYTKLHQKGFEILGVSLDRPGAEGKIAAFTERLNMPWPQVYDGKDWHAEIATKYAIDSIPHAFLVDGDTGTILAEGNSIRGDNLAPAIQKALASKAAK